MSIQPVELYDRDAKQRVAEVATTLLLQGIDGSKTAWDEPKRWAATECVKYLASGALSIPILRVEPELKVAWLSHAELMVINTYVYDAVKMLQQQGFFSN